MKKLISILPLFLSHFLFLNVWAIDNFVPVIIEKIIRNPDHFTQGIKIVGDSLYESAGLYGESKLTHYRLNKEGGLTLIGNYVLSERFFAEDIEIVGERIYLQTWRENQILILNQDLKLLDEKKYSGEGWGIAYDGKVFITSDGSSQLAYRDPKTLRVIKTITVSLNRQPLERLNSLEYAEGKLFANVWYDDNIYIITPDDGKVVGIIDCQALVRDNHLNSQKSRKASNKKTTFSQIKENVLNGIAYDAREQLFYVTGKRWGYFYKITLKKK